MPRSNVFWRLSGPIIACAIFFVSFAWFRAGDILFTVSDAFYILGGFFLIIGGGLTTRPFGSLSPYWYLVFAAMLSGLLVSSLVNGAPLRWLPVALQYTFSFIFLPMILMSQSRERWIFYAKAFVLGIIALEVSAYLVYLYFDGSYDELTRFGYNFYSGSGRLGSFLGNPNFNAAMIAMTVPILCFLKLKRAVSLPAFLIALAILFTALVFTASASGTFATLMGLIIFGVVSGVGLSPRVAAAGIVAVAALFLFDVPLPSTFQERVTSAVGTGDIENVGSFADRYALMKEAWSITGETAIVGLGVDQFRVFSEHEAPVHNSYLLLWTEGGLLAFFSWIGLLSILAAGALGAFRDGRHQAAALGLAVFTVLAIFSMSSTHMYSRAWITPVLIALGPAFGSRIGRF
ncbi:MAG: O-antigen ligase family protein [Pseudomonadota bacterium]